MTGKFLFMNPFYLLVAMVTNLILSYNITMQIEKRPQDEGDTFDVFKLLTKSKGLGLLARCERGVSLVQVLMASTAIAGLALVGLKLAEEQKRVAQETYQIYLVEYFVQEAVQLLYQPNVCRATFENKKPDSGEVAAIRQPKTDEKEEILLYFPSRDGGFGDGQLYNGELAIKSYKINGRNEQANLKKNLSVLELELLQGPLQKLIIKSIPFSFSTNAKGTISDCSARVIQGEGLAEGFWKKSEDALVLENLNVTVGDISERGSNLAVEGRIAWESSSIEEVCSAKNQGVLYYNPKGKLVFCRDGKWVAFGQNLVRWNEVIKYRFGIKEAGQNSQKTAPHYFCFLSRQSINSPSDECRLIRLNENDQRSVYGMTALSGAQVTNLDCEASCVD